MENRLIISLMTVAILTGCADRDVTVETGGSSAVPVSASLSFSMPVASDASVAKTRQGDSVVQTAPDKYRGLKDVYIIPFTGSSTITNDAAPHITALNNPTDEGRVINNNVTSAAFYHYSNCKFTPSTASVLFYAKGANTVKVGSTEIPAGNKAYYGSTVATGLDTGTPANIKFSPEPIITDTETPDARATALASYLSSIANTEGWSTTTEPKLRALYLNFIHQDNGGNYAVIAGSSANIQAFVEELYKETYHREYDEAETLAASIRSKIEAGADITRDAEQNFVSLTLNKYNDVSLTGYPASIGLPAGAAALQWDATSSAFVPQTQTTVKTAITSLDRFVYPAELCYYGNSTIRTSATEVAKSVYENATSWEGVLDYYNSGSEVNGGTRSVAVVNPVEYGVAQLRVLLKQTSDKLKDANDEYVTVGSTNFPLTAVIVGGQYPVGYDFAPVGTEDATEKDMLFVYDSQVKTNKVTADGTAYDYYYLNSTKDVGTANTLVLQTYDNPEKAITIVLEFENRSGKKFAGHDGTVYPGTKFYLIGKVTPKDGEAADGTDDTVVPDLKKRLFTKDHITQVNVKVTSLENAYNVMPDLLAPRLEIGVELERDWDALMPSTTELLE